MRGLVAAPRFLGLARKWQDATGELAECDIIVGGVDSYRERSELEAFCRRMSQAIQHELAVLSRLTPTDRLHEREARYRAL